jgi:mono/diheme cytochrome c family protein
MRKSGLFVLTLCVGLGAAAADKKTERLFNAKCASCHGKDGKAQTEKGKQMKMREMGTEEFQKVTDDDIRKVLAEGFKKEKDGVKQEMDAFKDELKPADVDALVKMVREFKK